MRSKRIKFAVQKFYWSLVLIFILSTNLFSQTDSTSVDSSQVNKLEWFAYPYAFYTPETNFAVGVGGIMYFRLSKLETSNPSKILLSGYYTINNQYSINLIPELYFNDDMDFTSLELEYAKIIDKYYGMGSNSPEIPNPDYTLKQTRIILKYRRNMFDPLKIGLVYSFSNVNIVDKQENPYLLYTDVYGSEGGISSGIGIDFSYDTRNNLFFPSEGGLYEFSSIYFLDILGSDFEYNKYTLDLRKYQSFSNFKGILAVQAFAELETFAPPFYELSKLGGSSIMRGYFEGRYRDNNYLALQIEYRRHIIGRFGAALFFAVGDVAAEFDNFKLTQMKYSYGFGARYILDKEELLTVRADFGFGLNTSGVYFSIEEAF